MNLINTSEEQMNLINIAEKIISNEKIISDKNSSKEQILEAKKNTISLSNEIKTLNDMIFIDEYIMNKKNNLTF